MIRAAIDKAIKMLPEYYSINIFISNNGCFAELSCCGDLLGGFFDEKVTKLHKQILICIEDAKKDSHTPKIPDSCLYCGYPYTEAEYRESGNCCPKCPEEEIHGS